MIDYARCGLTTPWSRKGMASSGTCASRYGRIFGVMTLAPKEAEVVDSVPPCYFGGNLPAHSAQFMIA